MPASSASRLGRRSPILAAMLWNVSTGLRRAKNIQSVAKVGSIYRVSFETPLPHAFYAPLISATWASSGASSSTPLCGPNRHTGNGTLQTEKFLDLGFNFPGVTTLADPQTISLVVIDPEAL